MLVGGDILVADVIILGLVLVSRGALAEAAGSSERPSSAGVGQISKRWNTVENRRGNDDQ